MSASAALSALKRSHQNIREMRVTGYFGLSKQEGHWWFLDTGGERFFSLGMNHIDSATLRYPDNIEIWKSKYGSSQKRWLEESVAPDLRNWGFNTIGWTQEVIIRSSTIHRHSQDFNYEEYQWANLPYCHMLPFTEAHQWELETRLPDVFSHDFETWCDCVAREHCAAMADDPKLIGYFYVDCPTWVHARRPDLKGPWFDPELLESKSGRQKLYELASRYYRVTRDPIRRYDSNHLILGDRYEAMRLLPDEILRAAVPYVDVLSFQFFSEPDEIRSRFETWHMLTGKPILLADSCVPGRHDESSSAASMYPAMLKVLRELPCCIGWHYCGGYLKNRVRRSGFRDEHERLINPQFIEAVRRANRQTIDYVREC